MNRGGVPDSIKHSNIKKPGDLRIVTIQSGKIYSWYDKRRVNLLSTVHSDAMFEKHVRCKDTANNSRTISKPMAVELYTQFMGGVDRHDRQLWNGIPLHRTLKWWKKAYLHLLEVVYCQTKIVFGHSGATIIHTIQLKQKIIKQLLDGYCRKSNTPRRSVDLVSNVRFQKHLDHAPGLSDFKECGTKRTQSDCIVCSDCSVKRHQTEFICRVCKVPLHPHPCYFIYHTKEYFKSPCGHNQKAFHG